MSLDSGPNVVEDRVTKLDLCPLREEGPWEYACWKGGIMKADKLTNVFPPWETKRPNSDEGHCGQEVVSS